MCGYASELRTGLPARGVALTAGAASPLERDLSEPPPGDAEGPAAAARRRWTRGRDALDGDHAVVRADDPDGDRTTEPNERTDAVPGGASGWVSRAVSP